MFGIQLVPAIVNGGHVLNGPSEVGTVGQVMVLAAGGDSLEWADQASVPDLSAYATLSYVDASVAAITLDALGGAPAPETDGVVQAEKALVADENRDVANIRNLGCHHVISPDVLTLTASSTDMRFRLNGTQDTWSMTANALLPSAGRENSLDLGAPEKRLRSLHLSGEARIGSAINFSNDLFASRKAVNHLRLGSSSTSEDGTLTLGLLNSGLLQITTAAGNNYISGNLSVGKSTPPGSTLDVNGAIRGNAIVASTDGTATAVSFRLNDIDTGMYKPISNVVGFAAGGVAAAQMDGDSTAGNTRLLVYDVNAGAMLRVKVGGNGTGPGGTGRALFLDNV